MPALEVLFEDQWIAVINKSAGLLSVGFPGNRSKTAEELLTALWRGRGKVQAYPVHRLDRDTSGVMVFAKSPEARTRFMEGWQDIVTERTYRCVCESRTGGRFPPKPLPDSLTIDEPIAYNAKDIGYVPRRTNGEIPPGAERAVTRMRVLERGKGLDLVECELETGRKNQIRIHLAHLGHPILGDTVYGEGAGKNLPLRNPSGGAPENGIGRLALHARILAFTHPFTGDPMRFEAPEPAEFARILRKSLKRPDRNPPGESQPQGRRQPPQERGSASEDRGNPRGGKARHSNGSKYIPGK